MNNIYIVRHCKAEGQAADAQLTDLGVQQAHKLADLLSNRPIDYIISSPYESAYQTIKPLADKIDVEIIVDERLAERVLSTKNHPESRDMLLKTYDDLDLFYEGGESSHTAMKRVVDITMEVLNSEYNNAVIRFTW